MTGGVDPATDCADAEGGRSARDVMAAIPEAQFARRFVEARPYMAFLRQSAAVTGAQRSGMAGFMR